MSHEVESMAYYGEVPWHRLGTKVEGLMTVEEAVKAGGLDWNVELVPIYTDEHNIKLIEGYHAIRRTTDKRVYGVVGKNYVPVQNKDAFKVFDSVVNTGEAYYETVGSLKSGARIWLLANLKDSISIRGDEIKRYLCLTNSHDGTSALQIYWTPVRVVCMNTLMMSLSQAQGRFYARHTANVGIKVEAAKEILGLTNRFYGTFAEVADRMAVKLLPAPKVPLLLYAAFSQPGSIKMQDIPIQTRRSMDRVQELIEVGRGMSTEAAKGTVWGGYNAVAEYVDYYRSYKTKTADSRLNGIWFGSGAAIKQKAWTFCMDEVK